jgi:acyl carrier protein
MENIIEVILSTVAEITHRDAKEITPATRLAEDLSLKSVSRIELSALLEDALNIPISNFDILKPRTVSDIIAMVQKKLEASGRL